MLSAVRTGRTKDTPMRALRRIAYSPTLPRRVAETTTELLVLAAACGGIVAACLH
jgi:hypothetical protein